MSWATELQINQNIEDPAYIKISNHWVCVQAYYTLYLALRALFKGMSKENIKETHTSYLNDISNDIKQRPWLFPDPWKILCIDTKPSNSNYLGLPTRILIDHKKKSVLASEQEFYDCFTRSLKTTREKLLQDKYQQWKKKNNKKQIPKKDKENLNSKLYATSLFDFMYRLRIRSNYEDADIFLLSDANEQNILRFHESVRVVVWHTLLLLELLLAQHISCSQYEKIVADFLSDLKQYNHDTLLGERMNLIKSFIG